MHPVKQKEFFSYKEGPRTLKQKMQDITHRFQKAKAWDNPKKQKRLGKLLMQMETILAED